jgi:hypothetical protein
MLRVKTARLYQGITLLKGFVLVFSPILFVVIIQWMFPQSELGQIIAGVGVALPLIFALYFMRNPRVLREPRFTCPDCAMLIETPLQNSGADREPILYLCQKCDVLWYSGNTNTD